MSFMSLKMTKGSASVQGVGYLLAAASSPRRFRVTDWMVGCSASPADNAFVHIIQRATVAPTATTRTPQPVDPADTLASTVQGFDTVTVDGTLTAGAFMLWWPVNQRASVRWVSEPGAEIVAPATANGGFMFGLSTASTSAMDYTVKFNEL